ncbi:TPA: Replication-associated protein G2P [Escherichia coli]|uniref:phage/plasmid replication protein, II/X family n=1 Tax=Enterobacteriaceae TaxID=543 RepID=UPI000251632A|nr:phage/plasmid replication protein, II/X family [Escherichia coli]HDR9929388.1 Replication-associated protein G2P [Escherichia coli 3350-73 (13a)]EFJ8599853.1 Replication-associated protein G2P [Escherichia coli]EFJ8601916.1 Replication-associated protein G2P [Escherichia coli]EHX63299.1 phage/plasmid replication protein [Escherichia coli DEC13B]EID2639866.1 Replication-associated protein G2P [Escherichia coli]
MIDWFTGILPCTHRPLPAGSVVSVDADGAVEWETVKRLTVRGSHESTMKVRSVGSDGEGRATHLYIDGNPSKFLQGHSVIGSDDLQGLVLTAYARILALLHIPHDLPSYRQVMEGQFKISRIDINYMYSLSTLENVRAWLYAAEFKAKTRHGRACGKGGTVYLGKNSRRWSLKFYSKYDEHTSGKKGHQMADEFVKAGLLDWSKDKLRIELTLRTTELIDLNLTLGNSWNIETPNKLFSDYVGRIEMNQNTILTDEKIINLPRKIQSTYLLWKQGANMKEMLPKPTFYRHRKELLSFGIDINFYCESPDSNNVVPLVRTLEAKPAQIPSWVYEKGLIFDYNRISHASNWH